jgi:hypothetical protein
LKADAADAEGERVYHYTVEIRDLRDGTSRILPLNVFALIPLKPGNVEKPARQLLRLEDGGDVLEAADLDELRVALRAKYPDDAYERRLHVQRDREAEDRRREAISELVELLARAAVDDYLREVDAASPGGPLPG